MDKRQDADRQKPGGSEADLIPPVVFVNPEININLLKPNQNLRVGDSDAAAVSL